MIMVNFTNNAEVGTNFDYKSFGSDWANSFANCKGN